MSPLPAPITAPTNPGEAERSQAALPLPALIFCRSRKRVESVARELAATLGWHRVGAYHAGLTKQERTQIEWWFFSATDAVSVATCAYGMGVDKSNLQRVAKL
jgi:ATP-dependent DNA helicase RecQ